MGNKKQPYVLDEKEAQTAADWLAGTLSDYRHIMRPQDVRDIEAVLAKLPKPRTGW